MKNDVQIVLASASPRRRELLDQLGVTYTVMPVDIDERVLPGEKPELYVRRVTEQKAGVAVQAVSGLPVLAADTSVVLDGRIMGKPKNQVHALDMLSSLSGRTHRVFTAVSLISDDHYQLVNVSEVSFRDISEAEQYCYWRSGEPVDKAGAYAIQGLGAMFVREIKGSYSGVMGLPIFETAELLRQSGIKLLA